MVRDKVGFPIQIQTDTMITLTTLIIAAAAVIGLLILCFVLPHPITWLMTLIMIALTLFILWPKYQGQQQAMANGEIIEAAVSEVRHWNRKQSDTIVDRYEIIALAPNPHTGKMQKFVSPPMSADPAPYLGDTVKVKVDWSNPNAYVMDISFLPFPVH